jgi:hypothetical protein
LFIGQIAFMLEHTMRTDWLPGRHLTGFDGVANFIRVASSLFIREQRKRSNVSGTMAVLAVLLKNPDDFFIESHRRLRISRNREQENERGGNRILKRI